MDEVVSPGFGDEIGAASWYFVADAEDLGSAFQEKMGISDQICGWFNPPPSLTEETKSGATTETVKLPYHWPSAEEHMSDVAYGHYFRVPCIPYSNTNSVVPKRDGKTTLLVYDANGVESLYMSDGAYYAKPGGPPQTIDQVHLLGHFRGKMYYSGECDVSLLQSAARTALHSYWGVDSLVHYKWALDVFYKEQQERAEGSREIRTLMVATAVRMRMEPHVINIAPTSPSATTSSSSLPQLKRH